jgi:AmmeMemoRadiSam system protein A
VSLISEDGKRRLLALARAAVETAVRGEPAPAVKERAPELQGKQGCFVTLKNPRRAQPLRGCLGHFTSDEPLWRLVAGTARSSATGDPRFLGDPVSPAELGEIEIEISVLSPLERTRDPLSLELGTHGIYIKGRHGAGCFLPQVATEHKMSKEEFLSTCCAHKAGLPADAWREEATEVFLFSAEVFGEAGLGRGGKAS